MDIPIIYEDKYILVVNKPCGLLVVPTYKNEKNTLTSILGFYPCHRLDRETSGLIIYAKDDKVKENIEREFKERKIKKIYYALVQGLLAKKEGFITKKINGAFAKTYYEVLKQKKDFALVKIMPFTGRTNQIRIHFKGIGHPILGDYRFFLRRNFRVKARRLMLHAKELEFRHPITKEILSLECELPEEFLSFLK